MCATDGDDEYTMLPFASQFSVQEACSKAEA